MYMPNSFKFLQFVAKISYLYICLLQEFSYVSHPHLRLIIYHYLLSFFRNYHY